MLMGIVIGRGAPVDGSVGRIASLFIKCRNSCKEISPSPLTSNSSIASLISSRDAGSELSATAV